MAGNNLSPQSSNPPQPEHHRPEPQPQPQPHSQPKSKPQSHRSQTQGESFLAQHPVRSKNVKHLTDEEINEFIDDLDHDNDGHINYAEVERKLDETHKELVPKPGAYNVIGKRNNDKDNDDNNDDRARHSFLRSMMGNSDADRLSRDDFANLVRSWKIPSLKQAKKEEEEEKSYFKRLPGWRKIRAWWAVHGPDVCFLALVVGMQLAFGIWQLVKYQTTPGYRAAFGWGVVMAKTCAGTLYPTFFFLIISMSRYLSTFLRSSYYISRFINWDLSQKFHIRISCLALLLASLHAIGHLTGSFVHGSDRSNEDAVAALLGQDAVPRPYIEYVRSLPGFTGITALGLFYTLALLSMPQVRKWNYEVFQLGHLLMFPIIGLMMAHGTAHLLQWPMFGYFLAFPTLLVVVERVVRLFLGFHRINATMKVLDGETVEITAIIPSERLWKYEAGQYIFLQVPEISFFQWHPFTVSMCRGNKMMVHIKTDGDWTGKLRKLGGESGESEIQVGINGPFGAPAQRFYDFNHSIIIGAGIGVTPFSGILADLQHKDDEAHGGPGHHHHHHHNHNRNLPRHNSQDSETTAAAPEPPNRTDSSSSSSNSESDQNTSNNHDAGDNSYRNRGNSVDPGVINNKHKPSAHAANTFTDDYRRVDFHWMVRDRNYLQWLSDLLNEVSQSQEWHRDHDEAPHLDIRIDTHVTAKRKNISTHVYRWLLEMHRTDEHPASPLTGLLNPTHFGRPDFGEILDEHYEEMCKFRTSKRTNGKERTEGSAAERKNDYEEDEELKVGVFYCGAPVVGEILADKCRELTTRGREDGTKIEYHFMIEVFG